MTTRERVIVLVMAGTVLWAGSSMVMGVIQRTSGSSRAGREKAEVQQFADAQRLVIASLRLSDRERMILDSAAAPVPPNPLLAKTADVRTVEERMDAFTYSGFLKVDSQVFAIVNGREYRVADRVGNTDFSVESIHPDHVVLLSASGGRRIPVAMQSNNATRESP